MITKTLKVNGQLKTLYTEADESLADALRRCLMLTSVKIGCGKGQCGACSIIIDG